MRPAVRRRARIRMSTAAPAVVDARLGRAPAPSAHAVRGPAPTGAVVAGEITVVSVRWVDAGASSLPRMGHPEPPQGIEVVPLDDQVAPEARAAGAQRRPIEVHGHAAAVEGVVAFYFILKSN